MFNAHPFVLVAIASLLVSSVLSSPPTPRATTCNGYSELCGRSYGNVTFIGAHDSFAVGTNNLMTNQDHEVTQQLNDGVRMLQMQAHNKNGVIQLCHTSCSLYDGGTLAAYLNKVKSWIDSNANEVVTMLIVNINNLAAAEFAAVFQSTGLDKLSYAPKSSPLPASGWPTLGELIDQRTPLLTFLDNAADLSSVPYLLDEFANIWESEFDVTDIARFDCSVNRTKGDTSTQMVLINHFLDRLIAGLPAPNPAKANETNAASGDGSLGMHVGVCQSKLGRSPNHILVDFYEFAGEAPFQVAAQANGVQYNPRLIASPVPTTTSSGSPAPTSGSGSGTSNSAGSIGHTGVVDRLFPLLCGFIISVIAVSS